MNNLIIDYIIGYDHVYSQFFVFKSIDPYPCYKLIEVFSYNHVPVRKKLSLKTIKKLIGVRDRRNKRSKLSNFWIEEQIYNKDKLKTKHSYMNEECFVVLKDWISKETMD